VLTFVLDSFSIVILTNQNFTGIKLKNFKLKVPFLAEKVLLVSLLRLRVLTASLLSWPYRFACLRQ
jgi:hypothetical protein